MLAAAFRRSLKGFGEVGVGGVWGGVICYRGSGSSCGAEPFHILARSRSFQGQSSFHGRCTRSLPASSCLSLRLRLQQTGGGNSSGFIS